MSERFTAFIVSSAFAFVSLNAQSPAFQFRDVAEESGLMPAADDLQGHGAAWGDVDSDGWADLYIATFHYRETAANRLFLNRKGRFHVDDQTSLQVSTRGTGVVFADFDNDGDLDLYVGGMPGPAGSKLAIRHGHAFTGCSMFRNDGDARFTNISDKNAACPAEFGGRSATVLDIDGDGLLDLLVGEEPGIGYNGSPTHRSRLFRNLGDMNFRDVTDSAGIPRNAAGLGVASGDVNGDGFTDMFIVSTLGNYLMLNDGTGKFREAEGADQTFFWPLAKGDNMVCGVAIGDVNADGLPDVVLGQHFDSPWKEPVANRLYLNEGVIDGTPKFKDVTDLAGLVPLPMKAPHVEIQDFDNDGRFDLSTSVVMFEGDRPHPVIFRNVGNKHGVPRFEQTALAVNDFPTDADKATRRSGQFFEKMLAEKKVFYSAPGPTCDFDRDGRLDMVLASWWSEAPMLLLKNETQSGNWLDVRVSGQQLPKLNSMGIGARIDIYEAGQEFRQEAFIATRELAVGFGYASGQEAVAHFGLGQRQVCDVMLSFPYMMHIEKKTAVKCNQRIVLTPKSLVPNK